MLLHNYVFQLIPYALESKTYPNPRRAYFFRTSFFTFFAVESKTQPTFQTPKNGKKSTSEIPV